MARTNTFLAMRQLGSQRLRRCPASTLASCRPQRRSRPSQQATPATLRRQQPMVLAI